jgi:hypothetical protein
MTESMKENGRPIKDMEEVMNATPTETFTKVNSSTVKLMAREDTNGSKVMKSMTVNGPRV